MKNSYIKFNINDIKKIMITKRVNIFTFLSKYKTSWDSKM